MSSTRHAPNGSPMRQNKFTSSPDIERGLIANLVAARCRTVASAADRELIFWMQSVSSTPGGWVALAEETLRRYTERRPDWLDRWQLSEDSRLQVIWKVAEKYEAVDIEAEERQYEWSKFFALFPERLAEICLNPSINLDREPAALPRTVENQGRDLYFGGWGGTFADVIAILRELKHEHEARTAATFAPTTVSRMVWDVINEAHETGGIFLLHNSAGNGKSTAGRAYCEAYPGRARFGMTPASNDEVSFQREVAQALGGAAGLSYKAVQMRERNELTLRNGKLVLVLGAAQFLLPVSDYRYALPKRLDWILNDLAANGVPVVMIGHSSMFDTLGLVEKRTGWSRAALVNQVQIVELPNELPETDVQAVAAKMLPDANRAAQHELAGYMSAAPGYLHAGKAAVARARAIAARNHHDRVTVGDVQEAVDRYMTPALQAQSAAMERADEAKARCKSNGRNWRPDTDAQRGAKASYGGKKKHPTIVTSSDMQPVSAAPKPPPPHSGSASDDTLHTSRSKAATSDFSAPKGSVRGGVLASKPGTPGDLVAV